MVVIAFFALDQLLRKMPHSKLTVAARFSFIPEEITKTIDSTGNTFSCIHNFRQSFPSLPKDDEGLAAKNILLLTLLYLSVVNSDRADSKIDSFKF
jgi:hypothetical protein